MDYSVSFARHFARLVWLLVSEPKNVDEQKATLRALVTVSREGPVTLAWKGTTLYSNGQVIAPVFSGAADTAGRLAAHGVRELAVNAAASAADLLNVARLLAAPTVAGSDAGARLREGGATTVHLRMAPPAAGVPSPAATAPSATTLLGELELVEEEQVAQAVSGPRRTPHAGTAAVEAAGPGSAFDQYGISRSSASRDRLLDAIREAPEEEVANHLELLTRWVEDAQRQGDGATVVAIILAVMDREQGAGDRFRREFGITLRRMSSAHALRTVAALVPRRVMPPDAVEKVLARAGDDGADAVIELLTEAQTATDRRAYFNLLLALKAGIPTLLHMLGDDRWYVVRNAVDLLGELGAAEAERPVTALLRHDDERVRHSATLALLRLNPIAGRAAVQAAVQSESPAVRQQAIAALGAHKDAKTASLLLRTLDREQDDAVQRSIYAALGQVATPDAVQRLVDAAAPATGLFKRKSPALRVAAVLALGEAGGPEALEALRGLIEDKEKEVRDAALRALSNARRANEPRVTGVFEAVVEE